jgi:uncharacterized membrane protein YbhN (UPF0104 family)
MGVSPLFLCFKGQPPKCLTITGMGATFVAFAFLIWGVADLEYNRRGVEVIYIMTFTFFIFIILGFLILFLLASLQISESYRPMMNVGRILCLGLLVLCGIAFIFLLITWIILMVDYFKRRNDEKVSDEDDFDIDLLDLLDNVESENKIPGHEWGAVFAPSILGLLVLILDILILNALYKMFMDTYNTRPQFPVVTVSNQNTITPLPNMTQPELFPNNNNGPVPPMGNNFTSQVQINPN